MSTLKLCLLAALTIATLAACDWIGDSLTSTTEVTVNVGGASSNPVATVMPRITVTPTVTATPTPTEAAGVVTPNTGS